MTARYAYNTSAIMPPTALFTHETFANSWCCAILLVVRASSSMDRASAYGAEGSRFESWLAHRRKTFQRECLFCCLATSHRPSDSVYWQVNNLSNRAANGPRGECSIVGTNLHRQASAWRGKDRCLIIHFRVRRICQSVAPDDHRQHDLYFRHSEGRTQTHARPRAEGNVLVWRGSCPIPPFRQELIGI